MNTPNHPTGASAMKGSTPQHPQQVKGKNATLAGLAVGLLAAICYGFIPFFYVAHKECRASRNAFRPYDSFLSFWVCKHHLSHYYVVSTQEF